MGTWGGLQEVTERLQVRGDMGGIWGDNRGWGTWDPPQGHMCHYTPGATSSGTWVPGWPYRCRGVSTQVYGC